DGSSTKKDLNTGDLVDTLESIWFVCVGLCPYLGGGRRARTGLIHRSIAGTCCRSSPSESSPGTAVGWFRSPEPAGDATSTSRTSSPPPTSCAGVQTRAAAGLW